MNATLTRSAWLIVHSMLLACTPDPGDSGADGVPSATISSHASGDKPAAGATLFVGTMADADHAVADLQASWRYDGAEACPASAPDAAGESSCEILLDTGAHSVTLQVLDPDGNQGSDEVTLEVQPNGEPWAEILAPIPGEAHYSDELINLVGRVGDEAGDPSALEVWWVSSLDGDLELGVVPDAEGEIAAWSYLSQGEHDLSLYVRNTGGTESFDTVSITVRPPNQALTCSILPVEHGTTFVEGETVTLEGLVEDDSDPEDIAVTWSSGLLGVLAEQHPDGHGAVVLATDALGAGSDVITLEAQNELGEACTDSLVIVVEGCAVDWYRDGDGDGYGLTDSSVSSCEAPSGYASQPGDCDDSDTTIHPGADEYCDGVDSDCDGTVDDDHALDASTWYQDADSDGYGDSTSTQNACTAPSGFVADSSDCDDAVTFINPGADEFCDGTDNDCDGTIDEDAAADAETWYLDADGDAYGDPGSALTACTAPSGYVADASDCDDSDAGDYPGAAEIIANGDDEDCDGGEICYQDSDGDGYGSVTTVSSSDSDCSDSGEASSASDCDDGDAGVNPGATETWYDGLDADCDGASDYDQDGDGYETVDYGGDDCDDLDASLDPADVDGDGFSSCWGDCDDSDAADYPGATTLHQGIAMTCIGSGSFTMGTSSSEVAHETDESPQHGVSLTGAFSIGLTSITQQEFEDFMGYQPAAYTGCADCPVETLSWHEAAAFTNAVSAAAGLAECYACSSSGSSAVCALDSGYASPYDCEGYRLLTEAEWEYAARAGTTAAFSNGADLVYGTNRSCSGSLALDDGSLLDDIAVYCGNDPGQSAAVGGLDPNPWGLYDMHGNVYDWCHDRYGSYTGDEVDPWGTSSGGDRVLRGGGWESYPMYLRSGNRGHRSSTSAEAIIGLRLARSE